MPRGDGTGPGGQGPETGRGGGAGMGGERGRMGGQGSIACEKIFLSCWKFRWIEGLLRLIQWESLWWKRC